MAARSKLPKISRKDIKQKFPISTWITKYNLEKFRGDLIAGLAVGLMVVPQSLAIASVAGLPPHFGLYASFPGTFIYCIFGTSKDMNVGPTMLAALVTNRYNTLQDPQVASILAFISGIMLLIVGILRAGFIVQFISIPVFSGFISAAAISISVTQLNDLLGLPKGPKSFILRLKHVFTNLDQIKLGDAVLGITCIVILIGLHVLGKLHTGRTSKKWQNIARAILRLANVSKSALIVILATLVAYIAFISGKEDLFTLAGKLPKGLPSVQSPLQPLKISANTTLAVGPLISSFGAGIAVAPLIMYIESIAVAKVLAMRNKYKVDASQELIAIGVSNIFVSFFKGFPITGSFARSVLNSASGAATPFSDVISGLIVIMALQFITPVFQFIPMTVLAAMVIASVLTMIEFKMPKVLWDTKRIDLLPYTASFIGCFYELEVGILCGSAVSVCFILFRALRPRVHCKDISPGVKSLEINGGLWFPGAERIAEELQNLSAAHKADRNMENETLEILIDCKHVYEIDFTVARILKDSFIELKQDGIFVKFCNVESENVRCILEKSGLMDLVRDQEINENENEERQQLRYETAL